MGVRQISKSGGGGMYLSQAATACTGSGAMEDHPRNQPECEAQRTSEQACGMPRRSFGTKEPPLPASGDGAR